MNRQAKLGIAHFTLAVMTIASASVSFLPGCAAQTSGASAAKSGDADAPRTVANEALPSQYAQGPTSAVPQTPEEALAAFHQAETQLEGALDPQKAVPLDTDRCSVVCKALASMRNATDRLCDLTKDDRCEDAKTHLVKAESRAKDACPVCAGQ